MDLKNLYDELFDKRNYKKVVPPFESSKEPTKIHIAFFLHGINNLDEVEGKLTTTAYLRLEWEDGFLSWNKRDFNNISYVYMPQNEVWKPDVSLNNGFTKLKELGDDVILVMILHNGKILWRPFEVFETKCDINITKFPFDTQICRIVFRMWTSQPMDARFALTEPALNLTFYKENGEWDISSSKALLENDNFIVLLSLERRPEYYLLTLICPIILLSLLDIFTFVIPVDSGEKMGYSMTAYLAFAVFLTIVNSSLPINSRTTSYLAVFVISLLIKGTVIVMVTAAQVRLHHRPKEKSLPWSMRFAIRISRKICAYSSKRVKPKEGHAKKKSNNDVLSSPNLPAVQKNSSKLPLEELSVEEGDENDMYTWANACAALDGFFFCFFCVVDIILAIVFFAALQ
ncbi:acetylcholine receptor subunit alpha-like [Ylistrum balloti]|uniref:acetylcholine receptor subunit alpha-like n=1 Tax=Ylistrum balloti TaxID=509963 RepID=UPI0029058855|nr:acetylcholine receptor subunit alpha-like [Ylistrum balloti]